MDVRIASFKSIIVASKDTQILIMMMTRIFLLPLIFYQHPIRKIIKLFVIQILINKIQNLNYK